MRSFGKVLVTLGVILFIFLSVLCITRWYSMKKGCTSYLKLTGDAPTVQLANEFLSHALDYIERHNLTKGNSAILFPTSESDLEIWYKQILGAKNTADRILQKGEPKTELEQIENDNALMKIREVVIDHTKQGAKVTTPKNIVWFPYQVLIAVGWILVIVLIGLGYLIFVVTN
ncbi:hypothetical protein JXB28_00415 [Candidatus Woesearchaeota archaeon]|nr:hypothetical protein [Candidatus Woesearchaeota archaeon]